VSTNMSKVNIYIKNQLDIKNNIISDPKNELIEFSDSSKKIVDRSKKNSFTPNKIHI